MSILGHRVLLYPDIFVPANVESRHDGMVIESEPALGQALIDGMVVLSWSDIRRDIASHDARGSVIAARKHGEFFAVATEAFYCGPDRLRARLPVLYEQLRRFFRRPQNDKI